MESNNLGMVKLSNNIIRIDTIEKISKDKEKIDSIQKINALNNPTKIMIKNLSYVNSTNIADIVKNILPDKSKDPRIKIQAHKDSNSLIIEAQEKDLKKAKKLINVIDKSSPQIKIETRIIEIIKTDNSGLGISWEGPIRHDRGRGLDFGNIIFPNSLISKFSIDTGIKDVVSPSSFDATLGSINDSVELDLKLRISELHSYSKTIQNSSMIVMNKKTAKVTAGKEEKFEISTGQEETAMVSVKYFLSLNLIPEVSPDGSILLQINITNDSPLTPAGKAAATINKRDFQTTLKRQSGETAVIGGLHTTSIIEQENGLPFLSSIPLIGFLFSTKTSSQEKRELIIFVTPTIIKSPIYTNEKHKL